MENVPSERNENHDRNESNDGVNFNGKHETLLVGEIDSAVGPNINDIPQCLLLMIFSYVPFEERIQHLQLVCKYWNRLVIDYSLFKDIVIAYDRNPYFVLHLIKRYSELVWSISIEVWKRSDIDKAVWCLSKCKNLRRLTVFPRDIPVNPSENCKTTPQKNRSDIKISDLCRGVKKCKKLSELTLKHVQVTYSVDYLLREISRSVPDLEKLTVKWNVSYYTPEPMEINSFRKLQELRIDVADITLDCRTLESLLNGVAEHLKILKLYSRNCGVTSIMTNDLLTAISRCSRLEKLTFKYARWGFCKNITNYGFRKLFRLHRMKSLVLHCVDRISYKAFIDYFSLPYIGNFDKIEIQHCSYFNECVVQFIMKQYPHLKYKGDGKFVR